MDGLLPTREAHLNARDQSFNWGFIVWAWLIDSLTMGLNSHSPVSAYSPGGQRTGRYHVTQSSNLLITWSVFLLCLAPILKLSRDPSWRDPLYLYKWGCGPSGLPWKAKIVLSLRKFWGFWNCLPGTWDKDKTNSLLYNSLPFENELIIIHMHF